MKRIVLITGAAGGIGRATVEAFAEHWDVIAVDRESLEGLPPSAVTRIADIGDEGEVTELFEWLERERGRLEALVNNAAVQFSKPLVDTTLDEWDHVLETNLRSIFLTSQHAQPFLAASSGAIVNVGSVHSQATSNNLAAYAASKGGVLALTRATALEFAPVRVNVVLPGAIDTPMLYAGLNRGHLQGQTAEEKLAHLASRTAAGRVGQPAEVASAILFLADNDRSSFITGAALPVDGGALARLSTE